MFILIVLIPVQNMRFNDVNHSRKPDQPIVNPINKKFQVKAQIFYPHLTQAVSLLLDVTNNHRLVWMLPYLSNTCGCVECQVVIVKSLKAVDLFYHQCPVTKTVVLDIVSFYPTLPWYFRKWYFWYRSDLKPFLGEPLKFAEMFKNSFVN